MSCNSNNSGTLYHFLKQLPKMDPYDPKSLMLYTKVIHVYPCRDLSISISVIHIIPIEMSVFRNC